MPDGAQAPPFNNCAGTSRPLRPSAQLLHAATLSPCAIDAHSRRNPAKSSLFGLGTRAASGGIAARNAAIKFNLRLYETDSTTKSTRDWAGPPRLYAHRTAHGARHPGHSYRHRLPLHLRQTGVREHQINQGPNRRAKTGLSGFELDNGYFPKGANGLEALVQRPANAKNWHSPSLEKIPKDAWKNAFLYVCPGKHSPTTFDIVSAGPDEMMSTEDDIRELGSRRVKLISARWRAEFATIIPS